MSTPHPTTQSNHPLYDPAQEHDACGVGFLVDMKGRPSHNIVEWALETCLNLDHRGGCGCDAHTGDGAGLFMQIPHHFFVKESKKFGFELPEPGQYGIGFVFMSPKENVNQEEQRIIDEVIEEEGQSVLGWRDVPVDRHDLGKASAGVEPVMRQVFIKRNPELMDELDFQRKLYLIRRVSTHRISYCGWDKDSEFYFSSLHSRSIVYKGMLTTHQLNHYFPDLHDTDFETSMALVHSRFSTNTFPSWPRAQPFHYMCHNGEINTMRGNENWMHARQMCLDAKQFGGEMKKLLPIIREDGSDSQNFDNALEFLTLSGRSLPHAVMMMIPEPWERHDNMPQWKRDFYEYHACLMEPWDGPSSIAFSDGKQIGAVLDRNGLRPSRYYVTKDDLVIMSSEVGILPWLKPEDIVQKGRLEPGRMFLVNTDEGRIVDDEEVKKSIATQQPYGQWLHDNRLLEEHLPDVQKNCEQVEKETLIQRQRAFGYTYEEMRFLIGPSAEASNQPIGAMGNDTPLAVLSDRPQLLYNYFKQLFAQVTNPPIDPIREELVTATDTFLGSEGDLVNPGPESCRMLKLESPLVDNRKIEQIRAMRETGFKSATLPIHFQPDVGYLDPGHHGLHEPKITGKGLESALESLFERADTAINDGINLLILSDRGVDAQNAPIPALMAVSGLHHHLIRQGTRTKVSIILESGEPREVHHFALLLGYGCDVINPWLALESVRDLSDDKEINIEDREKAAANFLKANLKGVVKTMSKMGISTIASYRGAQIFEAVGLQHELVEHYFTKTASRVEGIDIETISKEVFLRHSKAFDTRYDGQPVLDAGGVYGWRKDGERHLFNPVTVHTLQKATRLGSYKIFKEYSDAVNNQMQEFYTLRGLMEFRYDKSKPVPIEEVEPASEIVKRFKTGAISYGAISKETHEALAIAMNRLGGKSNTGEGGEEYERFIADDNGDSRRSSIKQVASGRFGVTSYYLVNSDELQIKIVQGAKPGEGGELPGRKVLPPIAKTRKTTPGVGLISPPPHHDIYSIEDLAQLIHDLKNANVHARINTKLVSAIGVGTIASGVAKAKSDVILVSGYDGGTGASPRSSIMHAGVPWELGLAETNQTLLLNDLRSRITLEVDGQMKTGRDVAIAALLGAEEYGFSTAPLVSLGCLMMRVCHKNTCPVGIATQDPRLREKFHGGADAVVNFMNFVAEEMREIMAALGFRTVNEMVGCSDKLEMRKAIEHWKAKGMDYSKILHRPKVPDEVGTYCQEKQDHLIDQALDNTELLPRCREALEDAKPVEINLPIYNTNRVVGTILGSEVSRKYGVDGLPYDTIQLNFRGSAGQTLGGWIPRGITIRVEGDTNDYCGKGLSGGRIIVYPDRNSTLVAHENIITGNVCFYGATDGEAFIAGRAGERFCVRNSGVNAVIEGLGDHGCEYMTGGQVINLGVTGRNFAAGMSGGIAYILDERGDFISKQLNPAMVNIYQLIECADEEIEEVRQRIQLHVEHTGSALGKDVLAKWKEKLPNFVKILPSDYECVVNALSRAKERGLEGDDAIQAAFEENVKTGH